MRPSVAEGKRDGYKKHVVPSQHSPGGCGFVTFRQNPQAFSAGLTPKQAWPRDLGTRDMGRVPFPTASGRRGKGAAKCVRPLSPQDKDLVEEGGERKTPGKPGHSDLVTKSM